MKLVLGYGLAGVMLCWNLAALWLAIWLAEQWWEERRSPWCLREVAGWLVLCLVPVGLVTASWWLAGIASPLIYGGL